MAQWGRNVQTVTANSSTTAETSNGQPIYPAGAVNVWGGLKGVSMSANSHYGNTSAGSRANVDVLIYANDTPSAFINNQAVGIFGVTAWQTANNNNVGSTMTDHVTHAGWVVRRVGTGGIATAVPTAVAGSRFANGETITLSNGTSNATLTVIANSSGNMTGLTVTVAGGGWVNTSMVANAFNRELHVANVTGTAATAGYNNNDIITITNTAGVLTSAVWHIATNATGGIVNAGMVATNALNLGLFANTQTNAGLTFTVTNATGGTAAGNATTTGLAAVLVTSTGGGFTLTLGGRAGRVTDETLVAMGSLGAQSAAYGTPATSNGLNAGTVSQTYFPGI